MKRKRSETYTALAVLLVLTGCGGAEAGDEAASLTGVEQEWYDAALEEGTISWYTSHIEDDQDAAIEAFEERYPGVEVEGLRLTSGNLMTRYSQEIEANSRTADIVSIGDTRFVEDALDEGWFATHTKDEVPALENLDDQWFKGGPVTAFVTPYGICYNSETVATPPEEWTDVLDEQYEGRLMFPDFRNASVYVVAGQVWEQTYGEEFLEDLAAQSPQAADSMVPGLQSVANEQNDLGLACPPATAQPLIDAGAPLETVLLDPTIAVPHELARTETSPNPNGSKLLFNFLMTEEGQQTFVGDGSASTVGVDGSIPITDEFMYPDFDTLDETYAVMERYF